jgi:hypothetical protein
LHGGQVKEFFYLLSPKEAHMARTAAIALALIMLALVAWGLFFEAGSIKIVIDGQELTGPLKGSIGAAGLIVGLIALYCAAIFLLFVFAGIGVFILGGVIVAGLIVAGLAFPFLLVLLLPLAIVWAFIALIRGAGT